MRTVLPNNPKLIPENAEKVFSGQIFDVYHWQQEMFDGSLETFEMLKRTDTVKVIAIKDNKIVVLDEEQPHHKPFLDIPGGRHDHDDETELEAAKRELLEETGLSFKSWKLLSVHQPHTKIDWFVYLFLATDLIGETEQKLDTGENIEVKLFTLEEIKKIIDDPKNRYLPKEILDQVKTIEELQSLPEYSS